jgi:hypothetical protein
MYLMVSQAKRPKLAIVNDHFLLEFDNAWIIFVTVVALDETPIELYNPWKWELRAFGIVETANCLNNLLLMLIFVDWQKCSHIPLTCRSLALSQ